MKKDFFKELERLCNIYLDYINDFDNSKLNIYINNNIIKMKLINNDITMDEFGLAFNQKEKDSYTYISIILLKILFNGNIIYSKNNMFLNDPDNPTINIYVNDEDLFDKMFGLIGLYREHDFKDRIDNRRKVRNKVNRMRNANNLKERVDLTKKLLKRV